ncbi:MAG TPA: hypothetical protein VIJ46_00160 [Rhabdochlamydiaceae bacterium]
MSEMSALRKNKIQLSDYDYRRDIENRLLMAQFSTVDLEVLEEILYSSLTIPIKKLAKSLDITEQATLASLEKLSKTGLLTLDKDTVVVDKEMRKYYEAQIVKFDEDFTPGMEFLQGLLKKVPIHVLPTWYSISRTSNNIFDSIVEKYLLSPQVFQRYLSEIHFADANLTAIVQEVFQAPDFTVSSEVLIEKYKLTREQFEEYMLLLEFSFLCCIGYKKVGALWQEIVTPFHEWREYLAFLRDTQPVPIEDPSKVERENEDDFAFIHQLSALLKRAKKEPFVNEDKKLDPFIQKLRLVRLADLIDGRLYALESANDWLDMKDENKALYLYRHPLNRLLSEHFPAHLSTERNLREAEKSILSVLGSGWVYYDDFIKGVLAPLSEQSAVILKKVGKTWKYALPEYNDEESAFIKATVMEWLPEIGIISTGVCEGRDAFAVTPFGQSVFGR